MATASQTPDSGTPDLGLVPGKPEPAHGIAFRFRPLTEPDARQIARWRYPRPYDFYDLPEDAWPDLLGLGHDFQAVEIAPGSVLPGDRTAPGRADRWLPGIVRRTMARAHLSSRNRRNPHLDLRPNPGPDSELAGFVCFGTEAQVSGARDAGLYVGDALDIGLGLRPNLTGRGIGAAFFAACLDHAMQTRHPSGLRLAVATFNTRAITVYGRAGFRQVATCQSPVRGRPVEFVIMVRD